LSRATLGKLRGSLLRAGQYGKQIFGAVMLGLGVLIATGADKSLEAWLLNSTPEWLTAITTKY
jgi:cytochrome c-type biogenesis protein